MTSRSSIAPPSSAWLDHFRGKTVAVSGAGGFIGGCLVNRLAGIPDQIVRVAQGANWDSIVRAADIIFHFAAQTSAVVAEENPERDFASNVAPLRALLDACETACQRPAVIFAGTVTQAGIATRLPVGEDAIDRPVTTYDRHKLIAEDYLKALASEGIVRGVSLRLANVYGPGRRGGNKDRDILNRMIAAAVRGEPLTIYGAGDQVRDYVFVEDVVDAFLMAAAHADQVNGAHFVIGSGRGVTVRQAFELVAARVEALTGQRVRVLTADPPAALSAVELRHFIADSSRFSAATGWHANWNLRDGIDRTIEACACE